MVYNMEMVKTQKILYILAMLAFLSATFLVFAGCDEESDYVPQLPISQSQVVLWCYTADWCKECHKETSYVESIRATGKIGVEVVDLTTDSSPAAQAGITAIPYYQVFVNGQLYWHGSSIAPVYRQIVGGG